MVVLCVLVVKGADMKVDSNDLERDNIERVVTEYGNMIFKICLVLLSDDDAKDAVQETFLKYITNTKKLESKDHEKAWLIRVASNTCKNMLRFKFMHPQVNIDKIHDYYESEEEGQILKDLMTIPYKFKVVMILHYVEGYKVNEIAKIIGRTPSAVKMRLQKGRRLLKEEYLKEDL